MEVDSTHILQHIIRMGNYAPFVDIVSDLSGFICLTILEVEGNAYSSNALEQKISIKA